MTSLYALNPMTPEERKQHGAAMAKGATFDAIYDLWRLRKSQGWTGAKIAAEIDVDEGWLSKQFVGPRNWTMETAGILTEGLGGIFRVTVIPAEEATVTNYDAYAVDFQVTEAQAPTPLPYKPRGEPSRDIAKITPRSEPVGSILEQIMRQPRALAPTV